MVANPLSERSVENIWSKYKYSNKNLLEYNPDQFSRDNLLFKMGQSSNSKARRLGVDIGKPEEVPGKESDSSNRDLRVNALFELACKNGETFFSNPLNTDYKPSKYEQYLATYLKSGIQAVKDLVGKEGYPRNEAPIITGLKKQIQKLIHNYCEYFDPAGEDEGYGKISKIDDRGIRVDKGGIFFNPGKYHYRSTLPKGFIYDESNREFVLELIEDITKKFFPDKFVGEDFHEIEVEHKVNTSQAEYQSNQNTVPVETDVNNVDDNKTINETLQAQEKVIEPESLEQDEHEVKLNKLLELMKIRNNQSHFGLLNTSAGSKSSLEEYLKQHGLEPWTVIDGYKAYENTNMNFINRKVELATKKSDAKDLIEKITKAYSRIFSNDEAKLNKLKDYQFGFYRDHQWNKPDAVIDLLQDLADALLK